MTPLSEEAAIQKHDDQAGFNDTELADAIDRVNWYQTPEQIAEDETWIKNTTQAIIDRRKARGEAVKRSAEGTAESGNL